MSTAQSLASLGSLFDTQPLTFRNKLINGNFDIWQRGTSLSAAVQNGTYIADRWCEFSAGSTIAPSRQPFTLGQTEVPYEPTYYHRSVVASVAGANNHAELVYKVESVRTLAGQTATLSFWAKADASKNIGIDFLQVFGSGGSPSTALGAIGVSTCALTTAWKQFKIQVTLPSIAGKTLGTNGDDYLGIYFWFDSGTNLNYRSNNLGQQSGTFDIAQVQLEAGPVATPFEIRPVGTELALCHRYYRRVYNTSIMASGLTTSVTGFVANPPMRINPVFATNMTDANFSGSTAPNANQWTLVQAGVSYIGKSSGTIAITTSTSSDQLAFAIYGMTLTAGVNCLAMGVNMYVEFTSEL